MNLKKRIDKIKPKTEAIREWNFHLEAYYDGSMLNEEHERARAAVKRLREMGDKVWEMIVQPAAQESDDWIREKYGDGKPLITGPGGKYKADENGEPILLTEEEWQLYYYGEKEN